MPFTLAHPAAVLPLRGVRYLRTVPLIIGALVPDLYYYVPWVFGRFMSDTHTLLGSVTTDLVDGYLILLGVCLLRRPLTALLSARARWLCLSALAPFGRDRREWLFAPLAIVSGVWTHLLWDEFTHSDGWFVRRVAALSAPVTLGPYTGTVYHVLQYLSSVFGLIVLAVWYARLRTPPAVPAGRGAARSSALPVLVLVIAAATLIGAVLALESFARSHNIYRTLNVLLTHSIAWFVVLYLIAGTILNLEHVPERVAEFRG
jgi:hypothetical protein